MSPPRLSVVLPLVDERGLAEESARAWASQALAAPLYEVVTVEDGRRPRSARAVRRWLRPHDRPVVRPGGDEIELYQAGADAAQGEVLLFTESHALPTPETAGALLSHLDRTGAVAATLRSTHIPRRGLSDLEMRLGERTRTERPPSRWWAGVSLRGFAIRRGLFQELGGFRTELERFAETALAIELDRQGLRADEVPDAVVRHGDCASPAELERALLALGRGRRAYVEAGPRELVEPYVGTDGRSRATVDRGLARALCAAVLGSAVGPPRGRGGRAADLQALVRWAPTALAGARGALWLLRARARLSLLHCLLPVGSPDARLARFTRAWLMIAACGEQQHLSRIALPPARRPRRPMCFDPGEAVDTDFVGFHGRERDTEGTFRWTEPAGLWRLGVPPSGYRGTLRLSLPPADPRLRLYWNGRPLPGPVTGDRIDLILPAAWMRPGGEQHLVLLALPFRPSRLGSTDGRTLGIAVRSVELVPIPSG